MARPSRKKKQRNKPSPVMGAIPGEYVGKWYSDRRTARKVHRHDTYGIHGTAKGGAESVVLNGHPDDKDDGDTFTYVGCGGGPPGERGPGRQVSHQSWENPRNKALRTSASKNSPVRVLRGASLKSRWAPGSGFWYSGLYKVSNPRIERNSQGLDQCKFDFTRCGGQRPLPVEKIPDQPRTDIEVRRKMWAEERAKAAGSSERHTCHNGNTETHTGDSNIGTSASVVNQSREDYRLRLLQDLLMAKFRTHIDRLANTKPGDTQRRTDLIRVIGKGITKMMRERVWESPWSPPRPSSRLFRDSAPPSASTSPLFNARLSLPPEEPPASPPPASVVSSQTCSPLVTPGELPEDSAVDIARLSRMLWACVASCLPGGLGAMDGTALEAWYRRAEHGEAD